MTTVKLAGKSCVLQEPCLRDLKRVLDSYNQLAVSTDRHVQRQHLYRLIRLLLPQPPLWLWRISANEWADFLAAVPVVCQLQLTTSQNKTTDTAADWDYLYAHLCQTLGWDYDYVDTRMTLSRLAAFNSYWQQHPPVHLLVAAYLGYEKKEQDGLTAFLNRCRIAAMGKKK